MSWSWIKFFCGLFGVFKIILEILVCDWKFCEILACHPAVRVDIVTLWRVRLKLALFYFSAPAWEVQQCWSWDITGAAASGGEGDESGWYQPQTFHFNLLPQACRGLQWILLCLNRLRQAEGPICFVRNSDKLSLDCHNLDGDRGNKLLKERC